MLTRDAAAFRGRRMNLEFSLPGTLGMNGDRCGTSTPKVFQGALHAKAAATHGSRGNGNIQGRCRGLRPLIECCKEDVCSAATCAEIALSTLLSDVATFDVVSRSNWTPHERRTFVEFANTTMRVWRHGHAGLTAHGKSSRCKFLIVCAFSRKLGAKRVA